MRNFVLYFTIIIFLFCSCKSDKLVIPKDKFIDVLVDLHLADGVLSNKMFNDRQLTKNKESYYNYIYKKHNITRTQFDSTLYYYSDKAEELKKIYNEVVIRLTAIKTDLAKDTTKTDVDVIKIDEENIKTDTNLTFHKRKNKHKFDYWTLKREYFLPVDGATNPVAFKFETNQQGVYNLSADICVYPDDKTQNLRMTIYLHYTDGSEDNRMNGTIIKDGNFHHYTLNIISSRKKKLQYIYGWVLDHSKETISKHIDVKNIQLTCSKAIE